MSKIKVEKGIPLPELAGKGRALKYPWPEMEVGDSFAVEPGKHDTVRTAASYWARRHPESGIKFSVCMQEDGSYRCWRVK